jgi:hypothetical protein
VPGENRAADNRGAELIWYDRKVGRAVDQEAMLRIRDRLQAIEDELVEAGFDEFMVATDAGTFTWRTVERARAEGGEEPPPADADGRATSRTLHASRHHVC